MAALTFEQARETVLSVVRAARTVPPVEECELAKAAGRILGEDIAADRDVPALPRSVRDGFAVRAADLPGDFQVIGEVRAGERFAGRVGSRQAVEIMTGAPMPAGADSVVMVEHTVRENGRVRIDRTAEPHQFINPQGCEARAQEVVLHAGKRLDYWVSGWGTGGTLTGAGEMIKKARPETRVVAVEPEQATLLAGKEWAPHKIQGWTPNFIPAVLNRNVVDELLTVTDVEARDAARELASKEGIFCGVSSGAAGDIAPWPSQS